ncbi:MerR family transcriptional regulator [Actinomyces slackii]|uniref:HTH-type transcriptional regulator AdhR n=1 Tax=Actinomyces slackii TaxID=52774 RepID=A0A3S4SV25_9ACTO|nr:MerR family transcriptional regulator [Actinomyces slackii]VEG75817.1 HTH-type transcriptional regulator AdhR [Actinomyces slackii]
MTYTIGEAASRMGIATSTIRYYDKEGLLPTLSRTTGGNRRLTDEDLGALEMIVCLKTSGLPIRGIRQYMSWLSEGDATLPQRLVLFRQRRQDILEQIDRLRSALEIVEYKSWYYERAMELGGERAVLEMDLARVPEAWRTLHSRVAANNSLTAAVERDAP